MSPNVWSDAAMIVNRLDPRSVLVGQRFWRCTPLFQLCSQLHGQLLIFKCFRCIGLAVIFGYYWNACNCNILWSHWNVLWHVLVSHHRLIFRCSGSLRSRITARRRHSSLSAHRVICVTTQPHWRSSLRTDRSPSHPNRERNSPRSWRPSSLSSVLLLHRQVVS